MWKPAQKLSMTEEHRTTLKAWVRAKTSPQRTVLRAQICLLAAEGLPNMVIARTLKTSRPTVIHWRKRFDEQGPQGLAKDAPHGLSSRVLAPEKIQAIEEATLHATPRSAGGSIRMTGSIPSPIELSVIQRGILELIIQNQMSVHEPVEPERAILLLSEGTSETATARELGISDEEVRFLRNRWKASRTRIAAREKELLKAFDALVSMIFQFPNEEPYRDTQSGGNLESSGHRNLAEGNELRSATRALIEILHHKPNVYGINRSNWTQETLAEAFEKLFGQRPTASTVCRLLKQAGLSWKKSQKVLTSPDPNYREKVELLLKTLQLMKDDEDLFFTDELGPLQVKRYGGRCYTPKGKRATHPQNQRSKGSITLYAALSATTNQITWFYGRTKDSAGIIDLAEILFNQHHDKSKIYLTWDAASWHRSDRLVEWADELNKSNSADNSGPVIEFVQLPSSAQFLNVIEAVFSGMKRAVIHNSDYQSEEEMKTAISTHFRERNEYFKHNPRRAGKKIWEIDFFQDHNHIRSGNYREW